MGDVRAASREDLVFRTSGCRPRVPRAVRWGALLAVSLLHVGCGDSPAASAPVSSVAIQPGSLTLVVNGSAQLTATERSADGTVLSGRAVSWASSSQQVATISAAGVVKGLVPGTTIVTATSEAQSSTIVVTVILPAAVSIALTPSPASVLAGSSTQLTATAKDSTGAVIAGKAFTWITSSASVAGVDQSGRVTGVAAGSATITALADAASATAVVTVTLPPAATIAVTPNPATVSVGLATQLSASAKDASGAAIAGKTFTWASANNGVATVSSSGSLAGVAVGSTTVTASADGVTASVPVTVLAAPAVAVTQVSALTEGQAATITGFGFSSTAANDVVTVDGATAQVTQATPTALQIVVPSFDCRPKRSVDVVVAVGSDRSIPLGQTLSPASFVKLGVGQQLVVQGGASRCLQFDAAATGERYVLGVQAVVENAAALATVAVSATTPSGSATVLPLPTPAALRTAPLLSTADLQAADRWSSHLAAAPAADEREVAVLQPMARRALAAPGGATAPTVPGTAHEGDTLTVRFNNIDGNSCSQFVPITTTVRKISARGIFVEDATNPVALTAAQLDQAAAAFDRLYDIDVDNFGAPSDLDSNQRVVIVITNQVNRVTSGSLLGFVAFANFFPATSCPSSNEGEMFFLRAADPTGQYRGGAYSVNTLLNDFPGLLAHEFTHVIQASRRIAVGGSFMVSWLAESLATAAEEVVGLQMVGLQEGRDYGPDHIYAGLGADPRSFFTYMGDLVAYFGWDFASAHIPATPEECTWAGSASTSGSPGPCSYAARLVYGVPWTLIKTAIDRHAGGAAGQKQIFRALSERVGPSSGFGDLEAVFGVPMTTMIMEWAPVLYLDDRYPSAGYQLANWDLRALANAFRPSTADLTPRVRSFGTFKDVFNVRGGSAGYYDLSGASRPATALAVRDPTGAALPTYIALWIVRVQ
jgi:hypothetical protein